MSRFKPGDLALIIRCRTNPENVGKAVEVVQIVPPWGDFDIVANGRRYLYRNNKYEGVLVSSPSFVSKYNDNFGLMLEYQLMPLRGDQDPLTRTTDEPLETTA